MRTFKINEHFNATINGRNVYYTLLVGNARLSLRGVSKTINLEGHDNYCVFVYSRWKKVGYAFDSDGKGFKFFDKLMDANAWDFRRDMRDAGMTPEEGIGKVCYLMYDTKVWLKEHPECTPEEAIEKMNSEGRFVL